MSDDNVSASWDRGCRVPYVFPTRSHFIETKAYYTLLKVIHRDVVGKRCCFLVPNWAMWAEKNWIGEKQETKSNKEVCSSTRGLQSTWVHIKQTTLHWRFLVKKTVRFHIDLPTSRAQIFYGREALAVDFLCFFGKSEQESESWGQLPEPEMWSKGLWGSWFHIASYSLTVYLSTSWIRCRLLALSVTKHTQEEKICELTVPLLQSVWTVA